MSVDSPLAQHVAFRVRTTNGTSPSRTNRDRPDIDTTGNRAARSAASCGPIAVFPEAPPPRRPGQTTPPPSSGIRPRSESRSRTAPAARHLRQSTDRVSAEIERNSRATSAAHSGSSRAHSTTVRERGHVRGRTAGTRWRMTRQGFPHRPDPRSRNSAVTVFGKPHPSRHQHGFQPIRSSPIGTRAQGTVMSKWFLFTNGDRDGAWRVGGGSRGLSLAGPG